MDTPKDVHSNLQDTIQRAFNLTRGLIREDHGDNRISLARIIIQANMELKEFCEEIRATKRTGDKEVLAGIAEITGYSLSELGLANGSAQEIASKLRKENLLVSDGKKKDTWQNLFKKIRSELV